MSDSRDVRMTSRPMVEPVESASHALVVGINEYADDAIRNLRYARSDAEAVRDILEDPEFGRFEHVTTLVDQEATRERIIEAITVDLSRTAQQDDRVVIFFAGHGAPWRRTQAYSDGFEKYLLPANARLSSLPATAISMQDLQRHLQNIVAKRLVIFLDACYSGATSDAGGTRGVVDPTVGYRAIGMTDEYLDQISGEGRVVITACGASEVAIELPEIGHGLFTKHVLEGLRGAADVSPSEPSGVIDLDSLYNYVYDAVRRESLTRRSPMNPIRRGDSRGRIVLARYTTRARKEALALTAEASRAVDEGHLYDAVELWQKVVTLDPAERASAELERARGRLGEARRRLLQLEADGYLPEVEYTRASRLLNRSSDDHDAVDRIIVRHLIRLLDPDVDFDCADYLHAVEAATSSSTVDRQPERERSGVSSGTDGPGVDATPTLPEEAATDGTSADAGGTGEDGEHVALSTLLSGLDLQLRALAQRTRGKIRWEASVTNRNPVRIEQITLRLDRTRLGTIVLEPDETRTFQRTSRYKKAGHRTKTLEAIMETASGLTLGTSVVGEVDVAAASQPPQSADPAAKRTGPAGPASEPAGEAGRETVPEFSLYRTLSWWVAAVTILAASIGSAFLASWVVRVSLRPFDLIAPAASTDGLALLVAGLAWGVTYVVVGTSESSDVWECLLSPLFGYVDAFDGPGEFFRGILSAVPINFILAWGIANAFVTFGARQVTVSSQSLTYAVYSIFGVIILTGIVSFLKEELWW